MIAKKTRFEKTLYRCGQLSTAKFVDCLQGPCYLIKIVKNLLKSKLSNYKPYKIKDTIRIQCWI